MAELSIIEGIFAGAAGALVGPLVKWGIQELKSLLKGDHERVIKDIGVPSVAEYPTQDTAFQEILNLLLPRGNNGVKCVALHGQRGVGKTTIMRNLNNHFYNKDCVRFEMVIFIRVAAGDQTDERTEGLHILQGIAQRIKVNEQGDESEVARSIQEVLKEKIYLLILDGVRYQLALEKIWESLDISKHNTDSKVVITTHYPLPLKAKCVNGACVDRPVELKPLSTDEEWQMFWNIVGNNLSQRDIPKARMLCKRFCLCLPILISPIASSFKDEEPSIWRKVVDEYTSWAEVGDGDGDVERIYSNLQICYEWLNGQSEKNAFFMLHYILQTPRYTHVTLWSVVKFRAFLVMLRQPLSTVKCAGKLLIKY